MVCDLKGGEHFEETELIKNWWNYIKSLIWQWILKGKSWSGWGMKLEWMKAMMDKETYEGRREKRREGPDWND